MQSAPQVSSADSGTKTLDEEYQDYLQNAKTVFAELAKRALPVRGGPRKQTTMKHGLAYSQRISSVVGFPVRAYKYSLLRRCYPKSVFFYTQNYDIDTVNTYISTVEAKFIRGFLAQGKQVLLTINIPGPAGYTHVLAGILKGTTLFVINTEPTAAFDLREINKIANLITQETITVIDVNKSIILQDNKDDLFCITWALNALVENCDKDVTEEVLAAYLADVSEKKGSLNDNDFIIGKLNGFKSMYSGELERMYSIGGRRKTRRRSKMCSCSPDVGDCPKCKKSKRLHKMAGGKRKTTKKWIQDVVSHMKEGAFTKQALAHGETPLEYAQDVLKHPKKHTLKTRRRAQFLKNISKKKTSRSRK